MHSVRQIEVVRALAKHRHFGLAAKALGVTQPALTRSLKQIEDQLGVKLFDRQGVTPTLFGGIVLEHGERAVAEFNDLARELALAKGMEIGEVRLAVAPYPADISGERAVAILSERRPNLRIELKTANWNRVVDDVREGAVDLGLADVSEAEHDPELDVETLRTSQGVFYCRAAHPLTRKGPLALSDLLGYPFVGPILPKRFVAALPKAPSNFGVLDETGKPLPPTHPRRDRSHRETHRPGKLRYRRRPPQSDRAGAEGGFMRRPVGRGALAPLDLRFHFEARPYALARR